MKRPALDAFEAEALAELARVTRGDVRLEVLGESWGNANVSQFVTPAGWTFAVFNDAQEWDYLEWITSPDGRLWEHGDGSARSTEDASPVLGDWQPPDADLWERAPVRREPFQRARGGA